MGLVWSIINYKEGLKQDGNKFFFKDHDVFSIPDIIFRWLELFLLLGKLHTTERKGLNLQYLDLATLRPL